MIRTLIAGSAAFALGVWQDLALLVVAGWGVYLLLRAAPRDLRHL